MVAVVAPTTISIPEHPAGERWAAVWTANDSRRTIFADTISEIIAEIIPGYSEAWEKDDFDTLMNLRIDTLVQLANTAQATIVADLADASLTDEQINALLRSKEEPLSIRDWEPAIPLLLLTTCYEPFTEVPQPRGAISWLNPASEVGFLNSMSLLGAGALWITVE